MSIRGAYHQVHLGQELNTTPVAGANDTVIGANTRRYSFFTLPSLAAFYIITGIEWLNGTVVNGSTGVAIDQVDANPPVSALTTLVAWGIQEAQTGAGAIQKTSRLSSMLIPGGTVCGAFIVTASATGRYGTTTVASGNNSRAISGGVDFSIGNTTAWSATTEEPYIKVYYKAVL